MVTTFVRVGVLRAGAKAATAVVKATKRTAVSFIVSTESGGVVCRRLEFSLISGCFVQNSCRNCYPIKQLRCHHYQTTIRLPIGSSRVLNSHSDRNAFAGMIRKNIRYTGPARNSLA